MQFLRAGLACPSLLSSSLLSSSSLSRSLTRVARLQTYYRSYAKARELTLPALSPTMDAGTIVSWNKKEGDSFKSGDVLFQLQTDKSVLDVEAQDDGILAKIIAPPGAELIKVGAPIGYLADPGQDISKLEFPAPAKKQASPPPPSPSPSTSKAAPSSPSSPSPPPPTQKSQPPQQSQSQHHDDVDLLPSVRRLLFENHLEASQVKGTGHHGKILKADVISALKNVKDLPASSTTKSATKTETTSKPTASKTQPTQSYEDIPNNNIRVIIAKRLTESKTMNPHVYITAECNIDQLLAMRTRLNNAQKVKLSVNDFILKAAALTLRDLPDTNAMWANGSIRQLKDVDISVAVATDKGLITPIVKNTDKKGLATIATELKELATRARAGSLKPHEFQGGSFSVSNLGMFGITSFSAVINPPQAAILAVGAGRQEVQISGQGPLDLDTFDVAKSPKTPKSSIANVVDVTLSCDGRVIDEALAGKFLTQFQKYMANPELLVL